MARIQVSFKNNDKEKAIERGKKFSKKNTVKAVEDLLDSL